MWWKRVSSPKLVIEICFGLNVMLQVPLSLFLKLFIVFITVNLHFFLFCISSFCLFCSFSLFLFALAFLLSSHFSFLISLSLPQSFLSLVLSLSKIIIKNLFSQFTTFTTLPLCRWHWNASIVIIIAPGLFANKIFDDWTIFRCPP